MRVFLLNLNDSNNNKFRIGKKLIVLLSLGCILKLIESQCCNELLNFSHFVAEHVACAEDLPKTLFSSNELELNKKSNKLSYASIIFASTCFMGFSIGLLGGRVLFRKERRKYFSKTRSYFKKLQEIRAAAKTDNTYLVQGPLSLPVILELQDPKFRIKNLCSNSLKKRLMVSAYCGLTVENKLPVAPEFFEADKKIVSVSEIYVPWYDHLVRPSDYSYLTGPRTSVPLSTTSKKSGGTDLWLFPLTYLSIITTATVKKADPEWLATLKKTHATVKLDELPKTRMGYVRPKEQTVLLEELCLPWYDHFIHPGDYIYLILDERGFLPFASSTVKSGLHFFAILPSAYILAVIVATAKKADPEWLVDMKKKKIIVKIGELPANRGGYVRPDKPKVHVLIENIGVPWYDHLVRPSDYYYLLMNRGKPDLSYRALSSLPGQKLTILHSLVEIPAGAIVRYMSVFCIAPISGADPEWLHKLKQEHVVVKISMLPPHSSWYMKRKFG